MTQRNVSGREQKKRRGILLTEGLGLPRKFELICGRRREAGEVEELVEDSSVKNGRVEWGVGALERTPQWAATALSQTIYDVSLIWKN